MSVRKASNDALVTKAAIISDSTDVTPDQNKVYTYNGATNGDLYFSYGLPGDASFETRRGTVLKMGQTFTLNQLDEYFPACSVTSVTPATGAAAGGTAVVIKGVGFSGVSGVTFGGTAGTSFSVVDDQTIHVTTPAKTAGTYDVVVKDDGGDVTVTGGFVYT